LNWLDFLILLLVVAGMVRGFSKGLIFELSGLIGLIIAVYVSRYHSSPFAEFIHSFFNVGMDYCPALGMIMAFIVSLILVKVLAMCAQRLIKAISLGWLNSLLGALISAVKYTLVISVVFNVLGPINEKLKLMDNKHSEGSVLCGPVTKFAPAVLPMLNISELFNIPKNIEDSIDKDKTEGNQTSKKG
jgi:membrane protein required for colicin V production